MQEARRHPTFCRFVVDCDGTTAEIDLAIVDRLEARDYTDLHALAVMVGQSVCIDAALSMDAGLRRSDIAEAFARVLRLTDERFPPTTGDPASTQRYFMDWSNDLTHT